MSRSTSTLTDIRMFAEYKSEGKVIHTADVTGLDWLSVKDLAPEQQCTVNFYEVVRIGPTRVINDENLRNNHPGVRLNDN